VAHNDPGASPITPAGLRERIPWLLAFVCILIPALPTYVIPPGPLKSHGSPARVIALLFFGLVILGFILIRRTAPARSLSIGFVLVLLYLFLMLTIYGVGVTHVSDAIVGAAKTRGLILTIANTGLALYALTRVKTPRQRAVVLGSLTIGLTFACLVGFLQQLDIDLRFLLQPPGFILNTEDLSLDVRAGATRVMATSQHPIEFSVLAAVTVPLTIHFARHAVKRSVRLLALLACGVALLAMPAAVSRTGVVAIAAVFLVYMWNFKARHLALAMVGGTAAVMGYIAVFPTVANALWDTIINSEQDDSVLHRQADYATVAQTFHAHPIFGLGLGASPPSAYGFIDNEWLQAIVQGGIFGIGGMIVLTGAGIFGLAAALRSATTARERDAAYVLGSMFAGIMSSSFTFDLFAYSQPTFILFIVVGLLWSNYTVALPETRTALQKGHERV
jgi:polysaccharide biosynthesis protein PslJ